MNLTKLVILGDRGNAARGKRRKCCPENNDDDRTARVG